KPPARFTEAGLIQFMEKEGIGRPSTYASVISTLVDRNYVRKVSSALVPTFTGFAVTQFMERHFTDLVDTTFTSTMEKSLDNIAEGNMEWLPYLKQFYFGASGLETRIKDEMQKKDPEESRRIDLPNLPDVAIHIGKFGPYFEAKNAKASLPPDLAPADVTAEKMEELIKQAQQGPTTLGIDPESGKQIYLKTGSYGPYLQLGEEDETDKKTKTKRISVPKTIPLNTLNHDVAVHLLSLPRLLGTHPESGKEIRAGLGRFGPYVVCDGDFRSLKKEDDVLTITLERGLALLAAPKGTRGAPVLKTIGSHPKTNKSITLHNGKYGMYIKSGTINATIPKGMDPEKITFEDALNILEERAAKKKKK
ncbi:DNA topoisomerase I, partial [Candidatus Uhrbacteria bacterium]|nr:DNA topoisomerase I [Candidatus Uhrbacteria bacterium]